MPDVNALSLSGALIIATANQLRMANSVMHLFKQGFNPSISTPKADYVANECDYDGYSSKTIVAWGAPVLAGAAWATFAPTQTFRYVDGSSHVGNMVGGHWLEDSAGNVIDYAIYDPAIPMSTNGNAVIKTPIEVTPAG